MNENHCYSFTICGHCNHYIMGGYCRVFDCVRAYNDKPVKRENAEKKDD